MPALPFLAAVVPAAVLLAFPAVAAAQSVRHTPLVAAVQRVMPSVVSIDSRRSSYAGESAPGMGTGVIIDQRGYIATNYHVVEGVSSLRVTLTDGQSLPARIVARDTVSDVAIVKVEPAAALPVAPMGDSSDLMLAEPVAAIGNAFGYTDTVSQGIVSALHRDVRLNETQAYYDLIQTDAAINPGNSGGPLINAEGEMIGLNVAIRANAENIAFVIPANQVDGILARLLGDLAGPSCRFGVECSRRRSAAGSAVVVDRVVPASPADRAGVRVGDRLVNVAGTPIRATYDVVRAVMGSGRGDVDVDLERGDRPQRVRMALAGGGPVRQVASLKPQSADPLWSATGLRLAPLPEGTDLRAVSAQVEGGLSVAAVASDSVAARAGLHPGDVLIGLDNYQTLTADDVSYILRKARAAQATAVQYNIIRAGDLKAGWLPVGR